MSKYIILILIFTAITRLYHLSYPNSYVFDEVYHAFTAKEYLQGNKDAWNPYATPPKDVAYEWLHPPIAKEIMTVSMFIFRSDQAFYWRLPGAILGVLSVLLVYLLGKEIFKNSSIAVLAGFLFSVDGLNFVQSRTGMNDIYLVTFSLASVLFFAKKKFLWSAIFLGLAFSSKWPGIFLLPVFSFFLIKQKLIPKIPLFIFLSITIYLLSYAPYFLIGYRLSDFANLHQQIWWYQTNLKATHSYSSPWWSWPLNLYPVWYFVDYPGRQIATIFASGNSILFWSGLLAVLISTYQFIKGKFKFALILFTYFIFWLPWAISPRIMFLYHYSPAVPFLSLILSYQLYQMWQKKSLRFLSFFLIIIILSNFILLYPFLTGIPLNKDLVNLFFRTNLAPNPFI
ncbi:MAG: phospholipid carrier-dependent glycosyltransferase [Candidatus Daviesbacteria bacterium]|nr:MAG: phospholipid carrier-dependent glycosyltransferase [Candidatus Daviesbacteria bacterium]